MAAMLLVSTAQGEIVAVRFASAQEARDWEDENEADLSVSGCARVVSKSEALRLQK